MTRIRQHWRIIHSHRGRAFIFFNAVWTTFCGKLWYILRDFMLFRCQYCGWIICICSFIPLGVIC